MELPKIGNKSKLFRCAVRAAGAMQRAADLGRIHGGVMRIGRKIVISVILALSTAGSIAAGAAVPAAVAQVSATHAAPSVLYHT